MKKTLFSIFTIALVLYACTPQIDPPVPSGIDLTGIPYTPQPFSLAIPTGFPAPNVPAGYQFDKNIVELGRHLFYDKRLSRNNTMACV